jgi:toxin YoeB
MRAVKFDPQAFKEYLDWRTENANIFDRINQLIMDTAREPFKGIGKPEPLKGNFRGYWSRRITAEHRLIYRVENDTIFIVKCHGHYD